VSDPMLPPLSSPSEQMRGTHHTCIAIITCLKMSHLLVCSKFLALPKQRTALSLVPPLHMKCFTYSGILWFLDYDMCSNGNYVRICVLAGILLTIKAITASC